MDFCFFKLRRFVWLSVGIVFVYPLGSRAAAPENDQELALVGGSTARGSLRAELRPTKSAPLVASGAAGTIEVILVPEGSVVKKGQIIISLDSGQERAELAQAEASMQGTKAEMDRAVTEFDRIQKLSEDGIPSGKEIQTAKAQAEIARSHYAQAAAAVELARVHLAYKDIKSPIDGIFLKTNKQVGDPVERQEVVGRIVDISSLEMLAYCDARYFSLFKVGQKVDVKVIKSPEDQPIVSGMVILVDPVIELGAFRVKVSIQPSTQAVPGFQGILIAPTR